MKNYVFLTVLVLSVVVSWFLWDRSPEYIRQGGPLLILGLTCLFLVLTYCAERMIVLWRAEGRGDLQPELNHLHDPSLMPALPAGS